METIKSANQEEIKNTEGWDQSQPEQCYNQNFY